MLAIDPRTVLVVWSALNILFAAILALVGMQARNVKGVRQWAMADLLVGIALGLISQVTYPTSPLVTVCGAILLGLGLGLIYSGIEAFEGRRCRYWIPVLLASLILLNNYFFAHIYFSPKIRIFTNFLLFGSVHALCARALFIRIEQPLRTAYWLAGTSVFLICMLTLARMINVALTPAHEIGMFTASGVNSAVFLFAALAQMSMSLAFMLMINYTLANQLNILAATDALTGLFNRRSLELHATRQLAHSKRTGECLSIMMIDVDHFKQINDHYGHQAGDEVLRRLSNLMQSIVRGNDYLARYGGEEFCILLPGTNEAQAAILAERLRRLYEDLLIPWQQHTLRSSISIGIADTEHAANDVERLIELADIALYQAKHEGRNRIARFSEQSAAPAIAEPTSTN
ncbi:GGDEF domain-containing protein [Undibacterium flavidum]|uniref:diguanylate cyclase n=1 Tax=Undibacterium flavidum TaxID=2762297 RepID=A0ABR6Y9Z9_9BURK|nr:GGDEF domain-containing protein [Undibacterium flavidum]MBC3873454.1 GGDEF domain-containing protein [Undibacterium flavidum]